MIVLTALYFFVGSAFAQCEPPSTAQAVLECAADRDPLVRLSTARRVQAEAEVRSTAQRLNPDLETKATWGDGASQVEADLVQTVEVGGKRGARIARARAEAGGSSADLAAAKAETVLRTVSALYRLRQLRGELSLIDETLRTFASISVQLRSRPRLAPEQEVARSIFEMAETDYTMRRAAVSAEQKGLLKGLENSLGVRLSTAALVLPEPKQDWPSIADASSDEGPATRQAQAALQAAQAEAGAARAASWPDLRVGPSFQRQSSDGQAQRMLGFNLGLPLPLYHRNSAGRERARRAEEAAVLGLEAVRARILAERESERGTYEAAVEALRSAASRKTVVSSHERIEDFFERGLISSSLVIEAHRQMLELTRNRNELELAAVRALWRIRAIDGQVFGEKL